MRPLTEQMLEGIFDDNPERAVAEAMTGHELASALDGLASKYPMTAQEKEWIFAACDRIEHPG